MRIPHWLTVILAGVMLAQALSGLLFANLYQDLEPIRTGWLGNDVVTLVCAVPLLLVGSVRARQGSIRGLLLWVGLLWYALYNYAFYLLGTALNVHFSLYVAAVLLAVVILARLLTTIDARAVAASFRSTLHVRLIGGSLATVGFALAAVWLGMWAAHVFLAHPLPAGPEVFRLVAALDLTLMVPTLTLGGLLLWRRHVWGFTIATAASVQAALYLIVLSVNAAVAIGRGLAPSPSELPIWGTLAILFASQALILFWNIRSAPGRQDSLVSALPGLEGSS
jgi:hypothetical protein